MVKSGTSYVFQRLSLTDCALLSSEVLYSPVIWNFLNIGFWAKSDSSYKLLLFIKHSRFSDLVCLLSRLLHFLNSFFLLIVACRSWDHFILRKFPSSIYFISVNNKNRAICEICSKLIRKTEITSVTLLWCRFC